ncbi:hypothetical protein F5Y13DRAFT_194134 [Hypoxylon sp. FL1857]|nr:hypothetical protein F5Y13DRAFT_194134 [Hypoxylon sp. FL1857]
MSMKLTSCTNRKSRFVYLATTSTAPTFRLFNRLADVVKREIYKYLLVVGTLYVPGKRWDPRRDRYSYSVCLEEIHSPYSSMPSKYRAQRYEAGVVRFHDVSFRLSARRFRKQLKQSSSAVIASSSPLGPYITPSAMGFGTPRLPGKSSFLLFVKDISFAFDMRDEIIPGQLYRGDLMLDIESGGVSDVLQTPSKQALLNNEDGVLLKKIHERRTSNIELVWEYRIRHLRELACLDCLQLDFYNCHCPIGCCRLTKFVCDHLGKKWSKAVPKVIEIMGWKDTEEKIMILTCLRQAGVEVGSIKFISRT